MVTLRGGSTTDGGNGAVGSSVPRERHLVTGGGGYAGFHLGKALAERGHSVILLDVKEPAEDLPERTTFITVDIRNYNEVEEACKDVDCVYHLASYGMSGREQLSKKLIQEVNVQGTKNLIKACCKLNITKIVYTSTYNVIFGGQVIENGDESLPYLPLDKHPDQYSRTKSIAEQEILAANGKQTSDGGILRTCALRLAGVYGPGEQRHLPRIVGYIRRGWFSFTYGSKDSLVEFLHVDNLVQAHVKAGEALSSHKNHIAAGQAYFISDCKPVNNFVFFRPLIEGLGYKYPNLSLPISLIYFVAFVTEIIHSIVGRIYNFQPLLTRTEVYKTGVTHWFNNGKAKSQLGYRPTVQNDMDSVLKWFRNRGYSKRKHEAKGWSSFLVDLILVAIFATLIMSFLPIAS